MLNISSAVFMVNRRLLRVISQSFLENLSTLMRMQVYPSELGRSVMKSSPMCDQGWCRMGRGRSFPAGNFRGLFYIAHSERPATYLLTSLSMFGHQKQSCRSERVRSAPGCPVPNEECLYSSRAILMASSSQFPIS